MLRGKFSEKSVKHSIQSSEVHEKDKERQLDVKQKKKAVKFIAVKLEEVKPDAFESNVSGVGDGRNYFRGADQTLREADPEEWEEKAIKLGRAADFYHRPMTRPNGDIYWRKETIKGGDLERWTTELRPDHSRALEYILGDKSIPREKIDEALGKIHAEQVRLFESIYGRKVVMVAEHSDSGHYHTDLWNLGLETREVIAKGKKQEVVLRTPMREKGVGPGTARYFRHQRALAESGADPTKLMGITTEVIRQNTEVAKEQNGEDPRDLRYVGGLDAFVGKTLQGIAPKACDKALKDYSAFLKDSYAKGYLGAKELAPRAVRQIEALEKENGALKKLLEVAISIFNAVLKVPAFMQAVKAMNLYGKIVEFTRAVGIQLTPEAPEPVEGRTRTRRKTNTKEKVKEREIEMERKRRRKLPEEPTSPGIA
jgi:hypothetical protein